MPPPSSFRAAAIVNLRIAKTILPLSPFLAGGVVAPYRRSAYDFTLPLFTPDTFLRQSLVWVARVSDSALAPFLRNGLCKVAPSVFLRQRDSVFKVRRPSVRASRDASPHDIAVGTAKNGIPFHYISIHGGCLG